MNDNIMVSIICNTYNQDLYIKQALNSFLMQKTNFDFEVIVHDDASTDNTTNIIKEYEKKYPNIIKPIYEIENQYSKGRKITLDIDLPKVRGKYIALCEGDDFWNDENKLQKQFDFMENNKEYSLCIHNAYEVKDNQVIGKIDTVQNSEDINIKKMICNEGNFCATNSFFLKSVFFQNFPIELKKFTSDYIFQVYLASCGKIYCFEDYMSSYRVEAKGSWNLKSKYNYEIRADWNLKVIDYLKDFNKYTHNKYKEYIFEALEKRKYNYFYYSFNLEMLRKMPYKKYFNTLGIKGKVKFYILKYIPFVFKIKTKLFDK